MKYISIDLHYNTKKKMVKGVGEIKTELYVLNNYITNPNDYIFKFTYRWSPLYKVYDR